jgi:phenylacetate-coenzyme A ligase PaaK-like adenylate-forming protein
MLTREMVGEAIGRAMQGERLPPPALEALQQQKLRDLVRFAALQSPFYEELYRPLDPERVSLAELPVITKAQVQERFDTVVTDPRVTLAGAKEFCQAGLPADPWHLGAFAVMMSSGTSGRRGYYVLDGPGLADAIAQGFRQSNRAGPGVPSAPHRIAAVMLVEPFDAAGLLMRLIPESLGPKELIDIRQDFDTICERLNAFQPTVLSSFPYMLRLLAAATEDGRLRVRPGRITSSGDVLTASDRARVRHSFGVAPHDYYCSTEASYLAWECDAHDGLHVNADYLIVESVDGDNRPVPAGRRGDKILVTNLANRAMPLIRYEMSDQVEYAPGPCPCGCLLPLIRKISGRVEHLLALPAVGGGQAVLIPEHIDDFVGGVEGLANYQVIQEGAARLTVNFIPEAGRDVAGMRAALGRALEGCFRRYGVGPGVQTDLRAVAALEPVRAGSNKVCQYWNRSGAGEPT